MSKITNQKKVTFENLGNGIIGELADKSMSDIFKNILDINTDPCKERKMIISLSFTPSEDRDDIKLSLNVKTNLAGLPKVKSRLYLGYRDGKPAAVEHDPKQMGLFQQNNNLKEMKGENNV